MKSPRTVENDNERRKLVEDWIRANPHKIQCYRDQIIEECARVAEDMLNHKPTYKFVSDAIRALKDKP